MIKVNDYHRAMKSIRWVVYIILVIFICIAIIGCKDGQDGSDKAPPPTIPTPTIIPYPTMPTLSPMPGRVRSVSSDNTIHQTYIIGLSALILVTCVLFFIICTKKKSSVRLDGKEVEIISAESSKLFTSRLGSSK